MNTDRIRLLEQMIRDDPNDPFNHYALGMEYFNASPERSLEILKALIQSNAEYLPSYYKCAELLIEFERFQEAMQILKNGIELAEQKEEFKTLAELRNLLQNLQFELD